MGVWKPFHESSFSSFDKTGEEKNLPNPNPNNWELIRHKQIGDFLIVELKYLDCVNYEGRKIMIYHNVTIDKLKEQKLVDPHFSGNNQFYSPIGRFEPTQRGWIMGEFLIQSLNTVKEKHGETWMFYYLQKFEI